MSGNQESLFKTFKIMKLTDKKKQQIILAAVAEFRDKGFAGTSMDNVAQRAEVSKRTVYNHFASKDELYIGIVKHMFGLVAETAPQPYQNGEPIKAQLQHVAKLKVDLFASEEFIGFSRVVMPEALHNPERMWQAMSQMSSIESDMNNWFNAAIADGQLSCQSGEDACAKFMGLIKMEAYWPQLIKGKAAPTEDEKKQMIEDAIGMFLGYYGK